VQSLRRSSPPCMYLVGTREQDGPTYLGHVQPQTAERFSKYSRQLRDSLIQWSVCKYLSVNKCINIAELKISWIKCVYILCIHIYNTLMNFKLIIFI
jgi:hypothetical protein